ncbi:hypothetical protein TeGR_g10524 [Tetraparma gracilis]|uniref:Pre-mRNA-splicing factor 38 n=1 Tax=Tetraparma gracilis TaxID=2962635 RepID=A0ABQ6NCC7_9STRA|nr:hypothetical protein TeGR_g10524 [Tetraparma gracilis]
MAPGVNTTDPMARSVHGLNPQAIIENITQQKIYQTVFWKESCFGLDAEGVLERGAELRYIGSTAGVAHLPCPFICLILKLLQISPEPRIVHQYVKDDAFKYLRALGCFYLRLVGSPLEIYERLEPCLKDYRKINIRRAGATGEEQWQQTTVDQFVEELLTSRDGYVLGIQLPRLPPRSTLEESHHFRKRADKRRESDLRGDKRVKEIVKHKRKMERVELGLDKKETKEEREERKKRKEERKFGSLFKGGEKAEEKEEGEEEAGGPKEGSDEYWNAERAKLGLAALKK